MLFLTWHTCLMVKPEKPAESTHPSLEGPIFSALDFDGPLLWPVFVNSALGDPRQEEWLKGQTAVDEA